MRRRLPTLCGLLVLVAGVPAGANATHFRPPPAVDPSFRLVGGPTQLPGYCYAEYVATQLGALLAAFDLGRAETFASGFTRGGTFSPYNGYPGRRYELRGRSAIAAFVRARHARRDGWTALQLTAPAEARATGVGIFGLSLRVQLGEDRFLGGAKVIVECATGRIEKWRGPAWA